MLTTLRFAKNSVNSTAHDSHLEGTKVRIAFLNTGRMFNQCLCKSRRTTKVEVTEEDIAIRSVRRRQICGGNLPHRDPER